MRVSSLPVGTKAGNANTRYLPPLPLEPSLSGGSAIEMSIALSARLNVTLTQRVIERMAFFLQPSSFPPLFASVLIFENSKRGTAYRFPYKRKPCLQVFRRKEKEKKNTSVLITAIKAVEMILFLWNRGNLSIKKL